MTPCNMYTDNFRGREGARERGRKGGREEILVVTFTEKNKILPVEQNMVSPDLKHSAYTKEMKS